MLSQPLGDNVMHQKGDRLGQFSVWLALLPERGQTSRRLHGALVISSWDVPKPKVHHETRNHKPII